MSSVVDNDARCSDEMRAFVTADATTAEPSTVDAVVEAVDLHKDYDGPPAVSALRGASVRIERGDYVAIVGPSGSGKSSLLHLIGLLDRPTAGRLVIDGIDVGTISERERTRLRCSQIGFVFQAFHLLDSRSIVDNVGLSRIYARMPRGQRSELAVDALVRVGLSHRLESKPATLSGGERQRVAIARAILPRPALLLADEPTGNLDGAASGAVLDIFDSLHGDGQTVVVITHDPEVSERAERVVTIREGRVEHDVRNR